MGYLISKTFLKREFGYGVENFLKANWDNFEAFRKVKMCYSWVNIPSCLLNGILSWKNDSKSEMG